MLTPNPKKYAQHTRARQKGVMLLITLIMLVAMTLAAIALVSSVDTSNLVSGNMAFQQTTIDAANLGTDQAISYIYNPATNFVKNCKSTSPGANCINGYKSWHEKTLEPPTAGQTWDGFWAKVKQVSGTAPLTGLPPDYSGAFVIEAMCSTDMAGAGGGGCDTASIIFSGGTPGGTATLPQGTNLGCNTCNQLPPVVPISGTSGVPTTTTYYRITTRVQGPRNSVSYIQSQISF